MAETRQWTTEPPRPDVLDGEPRDPPDWRTIDRLIVLMSLTVTKRMLRRRGKGMPEVIRAHILDRMGKLIEFYRRPR